MNIQESRTPCYKGVITRYNKPKKMYRVDYLRTEDPRIKSSFAWIKWDKEELEVDSYISFRAEYTKVLNKVGFRLTPYKIKVLVGNERLSLGSHTKKSKVSKLDWTTKRAPIRPCLTNQI